MGQLQQTVLQVSVGGAPKVIKKGQFAHGVAFMLNSDNREYLHTNFVLVPAELRSVSSVCLAHDGRRQGLG